MQQFMTGEHVVRVSARAGADLFVPYSRDDIVGEYDFSVEAGSTQPINDTVRKQQGSCFDECDGSNDWYNY